MQELLGYLQSLQPGPVLNTTELGPLVAGCWHEFAGSDAEKMMGYKVHRGIEQVYWEPPILTFMVVRHGGTVRGSTRGERQQWTLDIHAKTASCDHVGYKQVKPRRAPLDIQPLAEDIARLVINRQEDDRLKWTDDGMVRIQPGKFAPRQFAVKRTVDG